MRHKHLAVVAAGLLAGLTYGLTGGGLAYAQAQCVAPPDGLVGWWPGDGTAEDISGNDNDGTLVDANYSGDGKVGQAFALNPTGPLDDSYVGVPNNWVLEPSGAVTVDAWVRSAGPGDNRYIVSKGAEFCGWSSYALYALNGGLAFYVTKAVDVHGNVAFGESPNAGSTIWDGAWHHVAGTYDGSRVRLYVDGVEVGDGTQHTGDIKYGLADSNALVLGRFAGDGCSGFGTNLPFTGDVDEVEIFDRALSATEVRAIYGAGSWGKCKDDAPPAVTALLAVPNPVPVNTSAALTATVDDTDTGNSPIASADYSVDGGTFEPMTADDGDFDSPTEVVEATLPVFSEAGVHEVCVRGTDEPGNTSVPADDRKDACILVVAYDASAGFVTGGGWIYSSQGACQYDEVCAGAAGKANFGFVSLYKKGATIPTGNTEFNFVAGGLDFHFEAYEWLVVNINGTNAQYKGSGTINGSLSPSGETYKFMLWAWDFGKTGTDTLRIKIWYVDASNEVVVYDNGFQQAIGGGNIVVHAK